MRRRVAEHYRMTEWVSSMFGVTLGTVLLILLALASSRQFSLEFLEGTQHL
jgi:hypothetical protein